jgi:predicted S18 family serine protease
MKKLWILVVLAILLAPAVFAEVDSIKLLALSGTGENATGVTADLTLETTEGDQEVYLNTFPLTRIATQISMRFAQQVACDELETDCSRTDFFYTIHASPGIVGGPSAGAAAAILTAAMIDDREIDDSVAITGTINSGGLIGPVGGLKKKVEAGAKKKLSKVLIPKGTAHLTEDNSTIDLIAYGESLGVEVIEVGTLSEALEIVTGEPIYYQESEFVIDGDYKQTMRDIAIDLCTRGRNLLKEDEIMTEEFESVLNLSNTADSLFAEHEYYSAASYCFRANIEIAEIKYRKDDLDVDDVHKIVAATTLDVLSIDGNAERQDLNTITDVQTYMMVKERIFESQEVLGRLAETENVTNRTIRNLAYAQERGFSAETWSRFFDNNGQQYVVDEQTLINSCHQKLGEAEERYNYVQTFFPRSLRETRTTLDRAEESSKKGEYVLCLHDAARAKSEADILLSVSGFEEDEVQDIIDIKLKTTERSIIRAQEKGIFPLIGYSYWEYAKTLRDEDPYSALLFAEYANELSNLDIYFRQSNNLVPEIDVNFDYNMAIAVFLSFLFGGAVMFVSLRRK